MRPLLLWAAACGSAPEPPAQGPPTALVAVAPVREGTLSDTWSYLGDVHALSRAELAAGASGSLVKVDVREGQTVARDQLLAEVDSKLAIAEYQAARAAAQRVAEELAQAQRTLGRMQGVSGGVLAATELETAESNVRALRATANGAKAAENVAWARVERHRVRAPFDGVIARRHADLGDWVDPGTRVLELVSANAVEVRVEAPLELARHVRTGDAAQLNGEPPVAATIVGLVPALDPVSRTSVVRLSPAGPAGWLVPGTSVSVGFQIQYDGGLVLPRDALVPGGVEDRVFTVFENTAKPVTVTVLASSADEVLVSSTTLSAADKVVVRGNERLRPEQPVKIDAL